MFGVGEMCLLIAVVVGCPAVGHQEVEDGWMVSDLWTGPADHQSAAVHMLHLHVDRSTAAHWDDDGGRKQAREKEGKDTE